MAYPFVDLVVVRTDRDVYRLCYPLDAQGLPTDGMARRYPTENLPIEGVEPLARLPFEDFQVWAPARPLEDGAPHVRSLGPEPGA
ncbi:MAG: hypothetical protein AB1758_09695, partial [Candidatus Eremiobacterota bacterium]